MWPRVGFGEEVKRCLWENLDEVVRSIPPIEKLFIGGDFNGHVGETARGYDEVHGGFGFGDRNEGGISLLIFAGGFDLVVANTCFQKSEDYLITFRSKVAKTQIDYLLFSRCDKGLCTDCKVILNEYLSTHHRLLVMDLEIKRARKKKAVYGQSKINWGVLTKDKAQELGEKLLVMGSWRSRRDTNSMWTTTANCIREAARMVLGATKGYSGGHKKDWWWNEKIQRKVKAKKMTYVMLV
ncbi:uncharacterized protein [Nicotiana tomentosiformis]|uniref:uncharacterized protein n=1 Tax=Nicotiana tomentosiformis TaxID=4098 RepID=UPI00388C6119